MPKRREVNADLDRQTRFWVRAAIRVEMARYQITFGDLAQRLCEVGWDESEKNLRNKVALGEMSAAAFLLCLKLMGCKSAQIGPEEEALRSKVTIDQGLQSDLIRVTKRDDEAGVFELRLGELTTPITIAVECTPDMGRAEYYLSHCIKTPIQKSVFPGRAAKRFGFSPGAAIHRAVLGLSTYYREAVEAGLTPDEAWLIPNSKIELT